jgi:hypothetical protein
MKGMIFTGATPSLPHEVGHFAQVAAGLAQAIDRTQLFMFTIGSCSAGDEVDCNLN